MAETFLGRLTHGAIETTGVKKAGDPLVERSFSALLPQSRRKPVEFSGEAGFGEFSVSVHKGATRIRCQDTAVLHISDTFAMLAILDGFGHAGEMFSYRVGSSLLALMSGNHNWNILGMDTESILRTAIENGLTGADRNKIGGTTAILCLLMKNGEYSISSIGDSVGYVSGKDLLRKHFDYDTRGWNQTGAPLHEAKIQPEEFASIRNILDHSITFSNMDGDWIETERGTLGIGETLLLASDGLTKNLDFKVSGQGFVIDPRGLEDLYALIQADPRPSKLAAAISKEIRDRMAEKKDIFASSDNTGRRTQDDDLSLLAFARLV
jgi:serine/threonine protein phosphatase PrpC